MKTLFQSRGGEPIRNQNHLYNTLRYDLTQHERHGLDAATALPSLSGRSAPVVEARRAMVEVMGRGIRPSDAAQLLGVVERSVYLLRHRPADPALVRAIRLQLGLRQATPNAQGSLMRLKQQVDVVAT